MQNKWDISHAMGEGSGPMMDEKVRFQHQQYSTGGPTTLSQIREEAIPARPVFDAMEHLADAIYSAEMEMNELSARLDPVTFSAGTSTKGGQQEPVDCPPGCPLSSQIENLQLRIRHLSRRLNEQRNRLCI